MAIKEVTTRMLDVTKKQGAVKLENLYGLQWKARGVKLKEKYLGPAQCSSYGASSGGTSGKAKLKNKKKVVQVNTTVMIVGPTGKIRFEK